MLLNYNKKNKGLTIIELGMVIVLAGILGYGIFRFFRDTFNIWWTTTESVDVQGKSRAAINEMSKYLRQASTQPVTISGTDSIEFKIGKSTADWEQDLTVKYFKDNSSLKRYMKGSTTTLIDSGVDLFYIWYDTTSRYQYVGTSLTVTQGDEQAELHKRITLRGRKN